MSGRNAAADGADGDIRLRATASVTRRTLQAARVRSRQRVDQLVHQRKLSLPRLSTEASGDGRYGDAVTDALPNDSQLMTVELTGPDRRVLELGCSAGHVTRRLVERGCTVVGLEIDPDMAAAAREWADEVLVADLDLVLPTELLDGRRFERIVVGDVFEHLKRPVEVLADLAELLEPGGEMITSIPNVTHVDVRLMLLTGTWRYQDGGLLDRTHLRFFDAPGVQELFDAASWSPIRVERTHKGALESELAPLLDAEEISDEVLARATVDPDASTYQFVVVAVPEDQLGDRSPVAVVAADGAPGASASTLERLLEENEYLRVRVRALEEDLEQVRWDLEHQRANSPGRRARSLAGLAGRSVRSVVRR